MEISGKNTVHTFKLARKVSSVCYQCIFSMSLRIMISRIVQLKNGRKTLWNTKNHPSYFKLKQKFDTSNQVSYSKLNCFPICKLYVLRKKITSSKSYILKDDNLFYARNFRSLCVCEAFYQSISDVKEAKFVCI